LRHLTGRRAVLTGRSRVRIKIPRSLRRPLHWRLSRRIVSLVRLIRLAECRPILTHRLRVPISCCLRRSLRGRRGRRVIPLKDIPASRRILARRSGVRIGISRIPGHRPIRTIGILDGRGRPCSRHDHHGRRLRTDGAGIVSLRNDRLHRRRGRRRRLSGCGRPIRVDRSGRRHDSG